MPEQPAPHAHERQHADDARRAIARGQIDALVAEDTLDDRLPSMEMKMGPPVRRADECVPLARRSRERADGET